MDTQFKYAEVAHKAGREQSSERILSGKRHQLFSEGLLSKHHHPRRCQLLHLKDWVLNISLSV